MAMLNTVLRCRSAGVRVGAHPSYPDLAGFGRRYLQMAPRELSAAVIYQISALAGISQASGAKLGYVKAHGALYNRVFGDDGEAETFVEAIAAFDDSLVILGQPDSALDSACHKKGLRFVREGFADRRYDRHGALVPRSDPRAMIGSLEEQVDQALAFAHGAMIEAIDGNNIHLEVDSICVHGDSRDAGVAALAIRSALTADGIRVAPFC